MTITSKTSTENNKPIKTGHTKPRAPVTNLEQIGRQRVANMQAILGVSHSTLYAGIKSGRYPSPDGYDIKMPYWKNSTIKDFLEA